MDKLIEAIKVDWDGVIGLAPRVILALCVLLVFYLLGKRLARLVIGLLRRSSLRKLHEPFLNIIILATSLFIGLVIALNVLGLEKIAVTLLAGGGVGAVILGFAFREIGENLLAGIFIAFSRPFKAGDAIATEDIEGKVIDIELRYTHLRTDDGRDIYVPSSQLFGRPVTNFTRDGFRRVSFAVGIDYANDAKLACRMLKAAVAGVDGVLTEPGPGAYIASLEPQFVLLKVYYWQNIFEKVPGMLALRTEVLDVCRRTLLENGFTVSSETTTNVAVLRKYPETASLP